MEDEKEETKVKTLDSDDERKAELTLLAIMEETKRDERPRALKNLGCPMSEYKRLKRKYRYVLRMYRKANGTYKGEFEDKKPSDAPSLYQIQLAHQILDSIKKNLGGTLA